MSEEALKIEKAFEEDVIVERAEGEQLLLSLDGFEGPIDLLLSLARDQKLDITTISILALANQYLDFIDKAHGLRLEIAADYLVMASWLAYLKSRFLIPEVKENKAEPTGEQMAEALAFQLRRLEAMRKVSQELFERPQLGAHFFKRGMPEGLRTVSKAIYEANLYELFSAYGDIRRRKDSSVYKLEPVKLLSVEEAITRLTSMLGNIPGNWLTLTDMLPGHGGNKLIARSALASTVGASLEMAKQGHIEIRQEALFAPIYVRKARPEQRSEKQS